MNIDSLFRVNKILDDVLYGAYGVNEVSVRVHGELCAEFGNWNDPSASKQPDDPAQSQPDH